MDHVTSSKYFHWDIHGCNDVTLKNLSTWETFHGGHITFKNCARVLTNAPRFSMKGNGVKEAPRKWWLGHSSKSSYCRRFVEIVFLWYYFGQDLMMYVYCQRTLSHFFYASSFGCMRWNKFDATLLPDEVFQNTSMHCDQHKWFLRIQLRLDWNQCQLMFCTWVLGTPRDAVILYVYMYVVFVWICVNQGFRFSMIVVTLDRAVSLSVS